MRRIVRRLTVVAGAALSSAFLVGTALAAFPDTDVKTYTGCLSSGVVTNLKEGLSPASPCGSSKQVVQIAGGDITKVTVTGALTGGGDNGALTIGLDPAKTVPSTCTAGQVPKWSSAVWTCAADNDTTYTAGTGLDLSAANAFSVKPGYRLPQGCGDGAVAKSNGSGGWACAADNAGNLPTVYFNDYQHVVDDVDPDVIEYHGLGGFSELPAGNYVFTTIVDNSAYCHASGCEVQPLSCNTVLNSVANSRYFNVEEDASKTDVWAAAIPAHSQFLVRCAILEDNGGFDTDEATLATTRIVAQQVGAINP
jgi:hypothetical protein